jgi:rubrerythrin
MHSSTPPLRPPATALECCHDIEVECHRFYSLLAEAHRTDPELRLLWAKTAKEETAHADQVRLAIKLGATDADMQIDFAAARTVLAEVKRFVADVRKKIPSPVDALVLAIDMEKQLAAFHVEQAVRFSSKAQQSLFHAMMKADDGHVAALERVLARRRHGPI